MATIKKRINISIGNDLEEMLKRIARRDRVPQATKATELLRTALEIEEDQIWASVAKKRDTKNACFITHEQAWA